MPPRVKYALSRSEQILFVLAILAVLLSIVLALCIGLVLPYHWTMENYVKDDNKGRVADYHAKCRCDRKRYTTNYLECIPRTFSQRMVPTETKALGTSGKTCELVQNYPYLVSLNVLAYIDDKNEKRYACSGTILSTDWILVGKDCIYQEDELKVLKVRAGSTYWSKGGTEHGLTALSEAFTNGPVALRVNPPFNFSNLISAVTVSKKGTYTKWVSAVSAGWRKGSSRKYDTFVVRKWTTTPCADGACQKGEIGHVPACGKQTYERAVVADGRLLIALQTGVCANDEGKNMYTFDDAQTERYQSWINFLLGNSDDDVDEVNHEEGSRKTINTTVTPLKIYEFADCVVLDPNYSETTTRTTEAVTEHKTKAQTQTETETETATTKITETIASSHRTRFVSITDAGKSVSSVHEAFSENHQRQKMHTGRPAKHSATSANPPMFRVKYFEPYPTTIIDENQDTHEVSYSLGGNHIKVLKNFENTLSTSLKPIVYDVNIVQNDEYGDNEDNDGVSDGKFDLSTTVTNYT